MIDLHLHLDGSLDTTFMYGLARKQKLNISLKEIESKCVCPKTCTSLNDYLTCFDIPVKLMQTEEALFEATYHLIKKLDEQGLVYAEIRFAPQLHTSKGLTIDSVIKSVLNGVNKAKEDFSIIINIILCCMRCEDSFSPKNVETIEVGSNYLGKGVVAVDLAGAEALYKTQNFEKLFKLAKSLNMPFVIHAGESDSASSVRSAVNFGASRIGHGIALQYDKELMKEVSERNIAIEMCPSSNLQTKAIQNLQEFPLRKFWENNILVTINTDNMTVSSTTISNELSILQQKLGLTEEEKLKLLLTSVRVSFADNATKTKLTKEVQKRLEK